jgi:hypothetical protein
MFGGYLAWNADTGMNEGTITHACGKVEKIAVSDPVFMERLCTRILAQYRGQFSNDPRSDSDILQGVITEADNTITISIQDPDGGTWYPFILTDSVDAWLDYEQGITYLSGNTKPCTCRTRS